MSRWLLKSHLLRCDSFIKSFNSLRNVFSDIHMNFNDVTLKILNANNHPWILVCVSKNHCPLQADCWIRILLIEHFDQVAFHNNVSEMFFGTFWGLNVGDVQELIRNGEISVEAGDFNWKVNLLDFSIQPVNIECGIQSFWRCCGWFSFNNNFGKFVAYKDCWVSIAGPFETSNLFSALAGYFK